MNMAAARKRVGPRLSVAVLYSGRFYGELTSPEWSKDHLENLIVPNRAAVFVLVDPVNVCDTSSAVQHAVKLSNASKWETASLALHREAKAIFGGWPNLYAKVVPPVKASDVDKKFTQVRSVRALQKPMHILASGPVVEPITLSSACQCASDLSRTRITRRRVGPQRFSGGSPVCPSTGRPRCTTGRSSSSSSDRAWRSSTRPSPVMARSPSTSSCG